MFFSSLFILIIPWISDFGVAAVTSARVLTGLSQGLGFPGMYNLLGKWSPIQERSTLLAICITGSSVGSVVSMMLTGYLCEYGFAGGWPSAFYVFGICGFVIFILLLFFVFETPNEHPRITKEELLYIRENIPSVSPDGKCALSWKKVFISRPVWAVAIAKFSWGWGYYTLVTKLPVYLDTVLHYPIDKNGFLNAFFHTAEGICSILSGFLSDFMRNRKFFSVTTIRKIFEFIGMIGPAVCLFLITTVGCDKASVLILLSFGLGFFGMTGGGDFPIVVDMAPEFAGSIFSFVNGIGCSAAFLSPWVAGLLLDESQISLSKWNLVFCVSAGFYAFGGIAFSLMASADLQPWGTIKKYDKTQKTNEVAPVKVEIFTLKADYTQNNDNS